MGDIELCWLCNSIGGIAVREDATKWLNSVRFEELEKDEPYTPLFVAHELKSDSHEVRPCPACELREAREERDALQARSERLEEDLQEARGNKRKLVELARSETRFYKARLSPEMEAVIAERDRQIGLWGYTPHDLNGWVTLLAEELGELAAEANGFNYGSHKLKNGLPSVENVKVELSQIAALAIAAMEQFNGVFEEEQKKAEALREPAGKEREAP